MFYDKFGVEFFSTSELLYPNMKIRLRLIRARPNFYKISDNHHVSLGIVDYSLYTRRIALKDDYHKKRMDMLAYTNVEFNFLETLAKTFIIPATQSQFIQEKIFNNEFTKQMTDQEDNTNLGKNVFDDNNQDRESWACLGKTCSRLLIVFLSQLFVFLLIFFGCFWRIHLSKTCDESTVWIANLCSAAGYVLLSPRLWTSWILQKMESLFHWLVLQKLENCSLFRIG